MRTYIQDPYRKADSPFTAIHRFCPILQFFILNSLNPNFEVLQILFPPDVLLLSYLRIIEIFTIYHSFTPAFYEILQNYSPNLKIHMGRSIKRLPAHPLRSY